MKTKKMLAIILSVAMLVCTLPMSVISADAESTVAQVHYTNAVKKETPTIDLVFENSTKKYISDADYAAMVNAFGYDTFGAAYVNVVDENSLAYIDWGNSAIDINDVIQTEIIYPKLSRDKNNKLVIDLEDTIVYNSDGSYDEYDINGVEVLW